MTIKERGRELRRALRRAAGIRWEDIHSSGACWRVWEWLGFSLFRVSMPECGRTCRLSTTPRYVTLTTVLSWPSGLPVQYRDRSWGQKLHDSLVGLLVWAALLTLCGGLGGRWALRWAQEGVRLEVPCDRGPCGPLDLRGPGRGKGR